jgi:hypothetical protein
MGNILNFKNASFLKLKSFRLEASMSKLVDAHLSCRVELSGHVIKIIKFKYLIIIIK